jgi:hypothetical protein
VVVSMTAPGRSLMPMIRSIGVLFLGACLVLAYQVQEFLAVRLDKWPLETHVTGRQLVTLEKAVDPSESGGLMGWQSGRVGRGEHEFGERTGEDCAQSLCIGQLLRSRLQ